MARTDQRSKTNEMPDAAGFLGPLMAGAAAELTPRVILRGLFVAVLVSTAALEAIRFGVVERPMPLTAAYQPVDPVVASVGREVLRVSDAFAHASFVGEDEAADVPTLIASGTVDDAIDHLALAQAAREAGVDRALEIRALVALAERQILAEAYLDNVTANAVTEEAIAARYEEELAAFEDSEVLRVSQIVVPSLEKAQAVRARLPRARFSKLAAQHSVDPATKKAGGSLGDIRAAELPDLLRDVVAGLPTGGISDPVKTDQGWTIVKVEARRAVRPLPLEERREEIAEELRREAIVQALDEAKGRLPVKMRSAEAIRSDEAAVDAGRIGLARKR